MYLSLRFCESAFGTTFVLSFVSETFSLTPLVDVGHKSNHVSLSVTCVIVSSFFISIFHNPIAIWIHTTNRSLYFLYSQQIGVKASAFIIRFII